MFPYLFRLLIVVLVVLAFRPSYAQDEPDIRAVVESLSSDLSTELARSKLQAFVAEFHSARALNIVRDYQKELAFREDFFLVYPIFTARLNVGDLKEIEIDDAAIKEMEDAYRRNIDVFRQFIRQARDSTVPYTFLELDEDQILKNQIQYAAILYDADPKIWNRAFSWSYFIPFSTGL